MLGFITFNLTAGLPGLNIAEEMVKLIPTQILYIMQFLTPFLRKNYQSNE